MPSLTEKSFRIRSAALLRTLIALAMLGGSWLSVAQPASADAVLGGTITGNGPNSAAVNPVTNRIYIANEQDNSITS